MRNLRGAFSSIYIPHDVGERMGVEKQYSCIVPVQNERKRIYETSCIEHQSRNFGKPLRLKVIISIIGKGASFVL